VSAELRAICFQDEIPVVVRLEHGRIAVRFGRGHWRDSYWPGIRSEPAAKCYSLARGWFNAIVQEAIKSCGRVYVIHPYREHERCAPACWHALRADCSCSCMGKNHGSQNADGWFVVADTCAVRWGERKLACRLLVAREVKP